MISDNLDNKLSKKNKDDEKLNTIEMGKCEKFRYMKDDADM